MSFYVYIHINKVNDKKYVGVTRVSPESRWRNGKNYGHNKHLTSAVKKYGWDNFDHQVFEVNSESEMFYLEKYLISFYETTNQDKGYNHSIGGEKGGYKECNSGTLEYTRQWYHKNRDRLRVYQMEQFYKHSEKRKEYLKKWRAENPDKLRAQQQRYVAKKKLRQNNLV